MYMRIMRLVASNPDSPFLIQRGECVNHLRAELRAALMEYLLAACSWIDLYGKAGRSHRVKGIRHRNDRGDERYLLPLEMVRVAGAVIRSWWYLTPRIESPSLRICFRIVVPSSSALHYLLFLVVERPLFFRIASRGADLCRYLQLLAISSSSMNLASR